MAKVFNWDSKKHPNSLRFFGRIVSHFTKKDGEWLEMGCNMIRVLHASGAGVSASYNN